MSPTREHPSRDPPLSVGKITNLEWLITKDEAITGLHISTTPTPSEASLVAVVMVGILVWGQGSAVSLGEYEELEATSTAGAVWLNLNCVEIGHPRLSKQHQMHL
jgi:hypothetical protein